MKTTIKLKSHDAAIVQRGDGATELFIPDYGDDEIVPSYIAMICFVYFRIHEDEAFRDKIVEEMRAEIEATPLH